MKNQRSLHVNRAYRDISRSSVGRHDPDGEDK